MQDVDERRRIHCVTLKYERPDISVGVRGGCSNQSSSPTEHEPPAEPAACQTPINLPRTQSCQRPGGGVCLDHSESPCSGIALSPFTCGCARETCYGKLQPFRQACRHAWENTLSHCNPGERPINYATGSSINSTQQSKERKELRSSPIQQLNSRPRCFASHPKPLSLCVCV